MAGDRLVAALSLSKYQNVKHIKLEFARDIEDKHLEIVRNTMSDAGTDFITYNVPKLKDFSIYWNVRVSDLGIKNLVKNCKLVTNLNLSACKMHQADRRRFANNIAQLLLSSELKFIRPFKNLSDEGLSFIADCKSLISLNLKWCVCITDQGVISIAQGCAFLEFLSLFGIVGVTDKSLEALSGCCSNTITTLDVNGCIGIKRRSREELIQLFPKLKRFKVHSYVVTVAAVKDFLLESHHFALRLNYMRRQY